MAKERGAATWEVCVEMRRLLLADVSTGVQVQNLTKHKFYRDCVGTQRETWCMGPYARVDYNITS